MIFLCITLVSYNFKSNFDCLPPINSKYTEARSLASFMAPWISLPVKSILYFYKVSPS